MSRKRKNEDFHRNPDGSYEGFLDAATANKMLAEWFNKSTEYAVRAVQKKDEAVRQMIEGEKMKIVLIDHLI